MYSSPEQGMLTYKIRMGFPRHCRQKGLFYHFAESLCPFLKPRGLPTIRFGDMISSFRVPKIFYYNLEIATETNRIFPPVSFFSLHSLPNSTRWSTRSWENDPFSFLVKTWKFTFSQGSGFSYRSSYTLSALVSKCKDCYAIQQGVWEVFFPSNALNTANGTTFVNNFREIFYVPPPL